jgi:hypothetical protein
MNTTKFDASKLAALLESREVVTLEELASALGTDAKATIFRKLKAIDYRASYSHRGRFYTLADEDKFDVLGLWSFEDIHFSSCGTLRETASSLVSLSDAGLYANELAAMLHVEVNDVLLYLVKEKRLHRETFSAGYLYCSPEAKGRKRQIAMRRAAESEAAAGRLPAGEISGELKAAIVLFFCLLDEQQRRLFAGLESLKWGYGGDRKVARLLGLDEETVARGRRQLLDRDVELDRARKAGGGRKPVEKKRPRSSPK